MNRQEFKDLVAFCIPFLGIITLPCSTDGLPLFENEHWPHPRMKGNFFCFEWCGMGWTLFRVGKAWQA